MFVFSNAYSQSNYYYKQGIESYNNNNFIEAADLMKLSISWSNFSDPLQAEMYYLYSQAVYHNSRLNYKTSIALLDTSIMRDNGYNKAYFLRGRIKNLEFGLIQDFKMTLNYSSNNRKKDLYLKSLSLYYTEGEQAAILFINDFLSIYEGADLRSIFPECNYSLAAIYSLAGSEQLALNHLDLALKDNYANLDFLALDFYNIRNEDGFIELMNKYNIHKNLYDIMSTEERIIKEIITKYVEVKINNWQKKGKFEKTADYQKRVSEEARNEKIQFYTQAAIDSVGSSNLKWEYVQNDYDADNESFMITFDGYNPIFIQVPISEAPKFDANFNNFEFNNFGFVLQDDYTVEIGHLEISDTDLGKKYIYDIQNNIPFSSKQFAFNFDQLEVQIDKVSSGSSPLTNNQTTQVINVGKSDVDTDIPVNSNKNKNTYALIIGNEDYTKYQNSLHSESNVDFARRDARLFAEYAEKTLGIPKENITLLEDAISSQMNREIEKIAKLSKYSNGEATIIFYYAGHGFPDEITKEAYIMPVDISGADVKYGMKLNDLYAKLTENTTQKVIVILDACFSGGGRNQGLLAARSVKIKPKENPITGNLVVFSASSGEQSSLPYVSKQHGMFTYFLLKKLKQTNGDVSLEELSNYITREVQINAIKVNSKDQNPKVLVSPDIENLWMDWKLY
jgi:hypothetical protein